MNANVNRQLDGKTALVTGGSRGIGAAIVLAFAKAGADVVMTYHRSEEKAAVVLAEARARGVRAESVRADAADAGQVQQSVAKASEFLGGRIDILVNNAGVFQRKLMHEATLDEFDAVMNVNLRGVFAASAEAAKHMTAGGRIINIGSSFGSRVPFPGIGLYATSKFAVAGLTRAMARDLAPKGITVNAIEPGPITTDMNRGDERHGKIMAMMSAVGRYGTPEDVANAAVFLALSASSHITGAILAVDGGFEA
jgi:NAD(P)-dependent dehydrogenase (short-subunit alcohol dehydrogenase family)